MLTLDRNHVHNTHKRYFCTMPDCHSKYRHPKSLWQHQKETHKQIRFDCDRCAYTSGRVWNLRRHKRKKHGEKNSPSEVAT
jgi:hypothetical protein